MSSKPTQTQTPSFTIISRIECWLYSIRGQIIMSHYFHIKKKSIIFSMVLVKFLTIVRWIYKIPSECAIKIRAQSTSACVTRDSPQKRQFSKLMPKNSLNLYTQSLGDHRRTGRGDEGGCSPPKVWATQSFWAARENLGKASFYRRFPFFYYDYYFEEINIFYFNQKSA